MPTIKEVALRAGVSPSTVSHVINKTRFVSPEVRERVLSAMGEIGYQPNALARSLRRGETLTLGLLLPDSANPFFAQIAHIIEACAFDRGYSVVLCNTEGDQQKERFYVDLLLKKQVDGTIFMAAGDQTDSLRLLLAKKLPFVIVDRDFPELLTDAVLVDNLAGGIQATSHLLSLGHRRIGCITGPSTLTPSADRVTGYKTALQQAGIPIDPALILSGDFHPESGYLAARQLLLLENPPTAIFACNDLMALGALRAASELSLSVPSDLSVVGFDDIELARYSNPPLTTIAQPIEELSQRATALLIERMRDRSLPYRKEILYSHLNVRASSGTVRPDLSPAMPPALENRAGAAVSS